MPATRKRAAKQTAKCARKLAEKRPPAQAGQILKPASNSRDDGIEPKDRPLSWWREHWSDTAIRRLFLETFIYVRNAFDQNKLVP
ncbi:MAG: hypothetical protein ABIP75_13500, partial [Pyrinomonadaceae bacterium]